MSPAALAAAYLKQYRTGAEADIEAFADVVEACGDLKTGLAVTLQLIESAADDAELSYVAAGPVEDLLKWHGRSAVAAFAKAAEHSHKVRQALAGVWITKKHEAFADWRGLMDKYYPGAFNWSARESKPRGRGNKA